jgi:hypothetical protein
MVGSQIARLTPDPSFAHNLGYRYPNGQCEAIFDIYASKPFEVFWALLSNPKHSGVPEDSKSPTLGVLGFTPTLGQSGVATIGTNLLCFTTHQGSEMISVLIESQSLRG